MRQPSALLEAYGRLTALADAGHAPSAELALWMYLNGPTLFGKDRDSTQEQLSAWAQLARQPASNTGATQRSGGANAPISDAWLACA